MYLKRGKITLYKIKKKKKKKKKNIYIDMIDLVNDF